MAPPHPSKTTVYALIAPPSAATPIDQAPIRLDEPTTKLVTGGPKSQIDT